MWSLLLVQKKYILSSLEVDGEPIIDQPSIEKREFITKPSLN